MRTNQRVERPTFAEHEVEREVDVHVRQRRILARAWRSGAWRVTYNVDGRTVMRQSSAQILPQ